MTILNIVANCATLTISTCTTVLAGPQWCSHSFTLAGGTLLKAVHVDIFLLVVHKLWGKLTSTLRWLFTETFSWIFLILWCNFLYHRPQLKWKGTLKKQKQKKLTASLNAILLFSFVMRGCHLFCQYKLKLKSYHSTKMLFIWRIFCLHHQTAQLRLALVTSHLTLFPDWNFLYV